MFSEKWAHIKDGRILRRGEEQMDRIENVIRAWPLFISRNVLFVSFACLLTIAGCSGMKAADRPPDSTGAAGEKPQETAVEATEEKKEKPRETEAEKPQGPADNVTDVKVKEYVLSPGDQINLTVYQHDELSRRIKLPPDGRFFYPMVGEIKASGRSLSDIREIIKKGLSDYKEQALIPGDEIVITVYRQPELTRRVTIPPDGYLSFPFMGEIQAEGRTRAQLKEDIIAGLSRYVNSPQVYVDIARLSNPKRIVDAQVSIEIVDFGGQKVFVLGEVRNPGVYIADGNTSVVEAISRAAGFTMDAKQGDVFLIRNGPGKAREITRLNLINALSKADMEQNPYVQAGDIIYVTRTFISNVDRFFDHLSRILSPILSVETGYFIGQQIESQRGSASITP